MAQKMKEGGVTVVKMFQDCYIIRNMVKRGKLTNSAFSCVKVFML